MLKPHDEGVLEVIRDFNLACGEVGLVPVLIGGIAVGLVAKERATKDVDALVIFDTDRTEELIAALERHGFTSRFSDMAGFARTSRFMTLLHTSGVILDLVLGCLPHEEELVSRATSWVQHFTCRHRKI